MQLYKFITPRGKIAVTSDETGANLPQEDGPWHGAGSIDFQDDDSRVGLPAAAVKAAIEKDGYCVGPQSGSGG